MLKAILFDIDNTLLSFDGYVRETMKTGFAAFGLPAYTEDMFSVFLRVNNGLWREIEEGTLTLEGLRLIRWNRIFGELGIAADGPAFETYFREHLNDSAIPEPGAKETLAAISGSYILCAASNGPYRQQVRRLTLAEMLPYFSHLFISEEIGAQKPTAEFFRICLERLGNISPREALIVGDSLSADIAGGISCGLRTCYYAPHGNPAPADYALDFTIKDLRELPPLLRKNDD